MKKKVFIIIFVLLLLLVCSIIGIFNFISTKDDRSPLLEGNVVNDNTIKTSESIDNSIEEQEETNNIVSEIVTEPDVTKKVPKQENTKIEKNTSKVTNSSTNNEKTTESVKKDIQSKNNTDTTNTNSKPTTSKPIEQPEPEPVEKPTEPPVVTQPTRCTNNNNHGMDVGNCGRWFNTKSEAIAYYEEKIKYWGDWWENTDADDTEADSTYYKNCPSGYEIWSCMYCSKWTINFYYR